MQAGLLNKRITLYKPISTANDFGEYVQRYVYCNETKARVINDSGNRGISNSEMVYSYTKTFEVRSYIKLDETYQIGYQNRLYRIISIEKDRLSNSIKINTELINE